MKAPWKTLTELKDFVSNEIDSGGCEGFAAIHMGWLIGEVEKFWPMVRAVKELRDLRNQGYYMTSRKLEEALDRAFTALAEMELSS